MRTIVFVSLVFLIACSNPVKEVKTDNVTAYISGNKLSILYNGKEKMSGGNIVYEANEKKDSFAIKSESTDGFRFVHSKKELELAVRKSEIDNVLGFYLKADSGEMHDGNQFIGLFFKQIPEFRQGVQIWRYKPWNSWTKPIKVSDPSELEEWDVQFFYWQYNDSTYGAAMPLSGNGFRTTLGSNDSAFGAKAYTYTNSVIKGEVPFMAVGFGNDPYQLFEQIYSAGMKMMGKPENLRAQKTYPEILEYFGWCSWNSSGNGGKLNEKLLDDAANSFVSNNFPLPWMIIDDGWSQNTNSQLTAYQPIPGKFPNGFKPVIETLKKKYGVKYVGAWQAFNCYWSGINKDSELGKQYENLLYKYMDYNPMIANDKGKECYMINPYSDSLLTFYDNWHSWMVEQGIDFVKVDNQLSVERMAKNNFPIWDVADRMHQALYTSVNKHFKGDVINCMDMTNDAFYNFGTSAVARTVEDYFPYEEKESYDMQKGNAAAHVTQALYNSSYFQQMVWPDFDMFESYNPNATFHAIARAISGGPVYVTDLPGKQNFEVLRPLVYADGRIIRADVPGRLTTDCLFQVQDAKPLKAFSFANHAGLLAIWNAADTNLVKGTFKVSDIQGIKGEQFVVYENFSKEVKVVSIIEPIAIELERLKYSYYNIVPIERGVANIGLTNKYNAPKTIEEQTITEKGVSIKLHEGGMFSAYLPKMPTKVLINNVPVTNFKFENNWFQLSIEGKIDEVKNVEIEW
jgi:raffinose synthase